MAQFYQQKEFNVRCEWGQQGGDALAPISDVIMVVDVLSFTTCVEIATANGAIIYPYRFNDKSAADYARSKNAQLAIKRNSPAKGFSLSPASLIHIPAHTHLVLSSPNGSTLTLSTGTTLTLAGCLRNAKAIAEFANSVGRAVSVIPAGERWENGGLRPAIEDLIGAGAIIDSLPGTRSPEAQMAASAYTSVEKDLVRTLKTCSSGKELIERGFESDVELAAQLNCSESIPVLKDEAYVNQNRFLGSCYK